MRRRLSMPVIYQFRGWSVPRLSALSWLERVYLGQFHSASATEGCAQADVVGALAVQQAQTSRGLTPIAGNRLNKGSPSGTKRLEGTDEAGPWAPAETGDWTKGCRWP
jgi:hypothetical protein